MDGSPLSNLVALARTRDQVWDGGVWHFFEEEIKPDEPKPYVLSVIYNRQNTTKTRAQLILCSFTSLFQALT